MRKRASIMSTRSAGNVPQSPSFTPVTPLASLYVVSGLPKRPQTWTLADPDAVQGLTHSDGAVNRWWRAEVLGSTVSPEVYARPDNEVYCCGPGDNSPVPDTVDDVVVDLNACQSIHEQVSTISQPLREGKIDKRQACFLPVVANGGGGPIVGEAKSVAKGLMIATGHTCWVSPP